MTETSPNILLIMSDEHDPAVTGCYGDTLVRTPYLDGLAAEGVLIDGCYCNSPLCVPSRLSFTAGRYISRIAAWGNSSTLASDDDPSLPRLLRSVGYTPYLCGKQHYDARRRYGFVDLLPHLNRSIKTGRGKRRHPDDREPGALCWHHRAADFRPGDHSSVLDHDRQVTATACDFLKNYHRQQGPFFLFAGYLAPHFPLIAPPDIFDRYRGRTPPPIPAGSFDKQPLNVQHQQLGFGTTLATPWDVQRGRDGYWALTEWFDGQVGKLLAALEDSDAASNTVVIYTSDHGENKGDHGMWWKNTMYEPAARVPLLVSWPARWASGQRRSGACSLVDCVQTIAAIAGVETPDDWDGDSLLSWLDDDSQRWKDTALCEYYGGNICSGVTMYRSGPMKYIYHSRIDEAHGPERELYDLAADPTEQQDLSAEPFFAPLCAQLHAAMEMELGEKPDEIETRCRTEMAVGYGDLGAVPECGSSRISSGGGLRPVG